MSARRTATSLAFVACFAAATAFAQSTPITLLHVADTHSHLDMTGPKDANLNGTLGGIAKAASIIGMTKMTEPNVLTLHGGDVFHGTFFFNKYFGVAELQMMQQLGFDAMAVGNHEFDFGPDTLAFALYNAFGMASPLPLLSANLDLSAVPELGLETWIQPSMIKDVGGVQVGIFAMTIPGIPTTNSGAVEILGGEDPAVVVGMAYQQMMALRGAGAQVVIFLSHLGYLYDEAIAANVPGIDVILGAHDHYETAAPVAIPNAYGGQTLVVRSGKHYEKVGRLRIAYDAGAVSLVDWALIPLDTTVPSVPELQAVVDQLKAGIVAQYGDVYHTKLAYAFLDIKTDYNPAYAARDSGMGNLITDALRLKTHTDIAITANGLISEGISKGYVVGADLFRPVSYGYDPATGLGFKLATFKATGAELVKGLEVGLAYLGISEDFFLQVSGITFQYDSRLPVGQRVVLSTVRVGWRALDPAKVYTVTVNEGIAMLLPMMGVQFTDLQMLPDLEYNVLRDYVKRWGVLLYSSQGRIKDAAAIPARRELELEDPAPTDMQGGCSAAGTTPAAGLALLALGVVLVRRRRR